MALGDTAPSDASVPGEAAKLETAKAELQAHMAQTKVAFDDIGTTLRLRHGGTTPLWFQEMERVLRETAGMQWAADAPAEHFEKARQQMKPWSDRCLEAGRQGAL